MLGRDGSSYIVRAVRWRVLLLLFGAAAPTLAAGAATVEVVPGHPTADAPLEFRVTGSQAVCWPAILILDPPAVAGEVVTLRAHVPPGPLAPGCSPGWPQTFHLAEGLPAGSYSAEFRVETTLEGATAFAVEAPSDALGLQNGRLRVNAYFMEPGTGFPSVAHAVPLGGQSGYFWFFDAANAELTVKILDGRAINGAYWLFVASMTDVSYTLEVERTDVVCAVPGCTKKSYSGAAGENRNHIDTGLYAE
jgi:hypothetical protein